VQRAGSSLVEIITHTHATRPAGVYGTVDDRDMGRCLRLIECRLYAPSVVARFHPIVHTVLATVQRRSVTCLTVACLHRPTRLLLLLLLLLASWSTSSCREKIQNQRRLSYAHAHRFPDVAGDDSCGDDSCPFIVF